jgi:glucose/arabinose dehydrogenase
MAAARAGCSTWSWPPTTRSPGASTGRTTSRARAGTGSRWRARASWTDRNRASRISRSSSACSPRSNRRRTPAAASFAPDGTLFVTLGERSILEGRVQARDLGSHFGKIVRIRPDGSVPPDNPFVGRQGARPEVWTLGHRNILAATLDAKGRLWVSEMGPRGGDELNLVVRGKDYGGPTIGYGTEYSGEPIHASTQGPGMEQPVYYWTPVISPSGMIVYTGDLFPEWRGNFFIGGLSSRALVRLDVQGDRVVGEERLLTDLRARIREVVQGPEGALFLLTDASDGKILKVTPR